jgi:hypothetical protein
VCTRHHGVLAGFTAKGLSWRNMAWTGNKKMFYVLEFAKTESIVRVHWRFWTMYYTEQFTDKIIREWYTKFQQSGCMCAAKWTGWLGPSAETVKHVQETFVRSPPKSPTMDISSTCKVGQKLGVSLPVLTCPPSAWPSWLPYRTGRKSWMDLWITLYYLSKLRLIY